MYQSPIVAHGFNHQSFYRQPISNLRQINEVVWNRKNEPQHSDGFIPQAYGTYANQQLLPEYENLEQLYSSLNVQNEVQNNSNKAAVNYHENVFLKNLPPTIPTDYSSTRQSRPINMTSGTTLDRLLARQSSLGAIPETKNVSSQEAIPLSNSRSAGAVYDYIQKERRAHTAAPLARIVGPSSTITTKMFASTTAPSDAQTISNASVNLYPQLNTGTANVANNYHKVEVVDHGEEGDDDEEEEEEEEDDEPIIVKVQYDPNAGPPSEDIIRQALDNQLRGQSGPRNTNEPIVLNFLNHSTQTLIPSMRVKPQQPMFNRSASSIPQLISQQQQQSLQQRRYQQQSLLQQQQQQFQLHEKQRQQQQKQEQQRRQQYLLQQQQQKLQQYLQQQLELEQQLKQEQIQRERFQWEQQQIQKQLKAEEQQIQKQLTAEEQQIQKQLKAEQQQIQKQLKAEQNEIQQLIQQQLQREELQQIYRQLYQQQKQQESQQRNRQIYQSQQNGSMQQNASLPPTGPRPSRTVPSIRTIPMNQSPATYVPNNYIHPSETFSSAPMPIRNPQQFSNITIEKLSDQNINSVLTSDAISTGLNAYNNYSHQHIPNMFVPIQFEDASGQPFASVNSTNKLDNPQNLLKRPHTAPSSTEMFRPSSALDTPELSQENLRSMLDQIPGLHGRRFSIEYAEPTEPAGYPIPSLLDDANTKYPEPDIVDQLPTNIIQHVRSSDNLELKAALNLPVKSEKTVQSTTKPKSTSSKLKQPPSKVLHHSARPKQRVKRSRPVFSKISNDSDSSTGRDTSDEETEVEEIEIIPLWKYRNYH